MKNQISLPEKILHLKDIAIFKGLTVGELASVATVTEEKRAEPGETVIKEGEPGSVMYLVLDGEVAVIKALSESSDQEIELARINSGDYFGEMALFENAPNSATIRAVKASHFMTINKIEFMEIVMEYPNIALHICEGFCKRIRALHAKINSCELDRTMIPGE